MKKWKLFFSQLIMATMLCSINYANTNCWELYWDLPDSIYTDNVIYWCDGNIPVISIYSWDKWITMRAMNEWATTIDINSTWSYGYYYQRGNNYWFESCYQNGCNTFSSWSYPVAIIRTNCLEYGPENPFFSNEFSYYYPGSSRVFNDYCSPRNDNLRGWSWDNQTNNWWFDTWVFQVINPINRRWMCDTWYHIPSAWELDALINLYTSKYWNLNNFYENFYLPIAWNWSNQWNYSLPRVNNIWSMWNIWSSSPKSDGGAKYIFFSNNNSTIWTETTYDYRNFGFSVRCFKDIYMPRSIDIYFMSGDVFLWSWECFENLICSVPNEIIASVSKIWYAIGWIRSGTESIFDFENTLISWDLVDDRWNMYFVVRWMPIEYTIKYELNGWVNNENNSTTYTIESQDIIFESPQKDWYNFDWWFFDAEFADWITHIPTWTTWNIVVYAKWTKKQTIGGWSTLKKDNCPDGDYSDSYYDWICWIPENDAENSRESLSWSNNKDSSLPNSLEWQEILSPSDSSFTKEQKEAYGWAYENWITTMDTIQKADLNGNLTRIAMAKMLSKYAINVLWMEPDETRINRFSDVDDKLDAEYDSGVSLAYQLWIMWINMPDERFRPFDLVPRSEFVTALSRMKYRTPDGKDVYYSTHMELLNKLWIVKVLDSMMLELRWYVMLMLMRSEK